MSELQRRRDAPLKAAPLPEPLLSSPPGGEAHELIYRIHTNDYVPKYFPQPYTLALDTGHNDIEIHRAFEHVFENFISAGGTDIVMESDSVYQKVFDDVKAGRAKLADFKDMMDVSGWVPPGQIKEGQKIFQKIMEKALAGGVQFHAYDEPPAAIKEYPDVWEKISAALKNGEEGKNNFRTALKDPQFSDRYHKFNELFMAERRELDLKISQSIKELGPNAKVLIL